jgi:hypothetical protein
VWRWTRLLAEVEEFRISRNEAGVEIRHEFDGLVCVTKVICLAGTAYRIT